MAKAAAPVAAAPATLLATQIDSASGAAEAASLATPATPASPAAVTPAEVATTGGSAAAAEAAPATQPLNPSNPFARAQVPAERPQEYLQRGLDKLSGYTGPTDYNASEVYADILRLSDEGISHRCWEPIIKALHARLRDVEGALDVPAPEDLSDLLLQISLIICNSGEAHDMIPIFEGSRLLIAAMQLALGQLRVCRVAPQQRLTVNTLPIYFAVPCDKLRVFHHDVKQKCLQNGVPLIPLRTVYSSLVPSHNAIYSFTATPAHVSNWLFIVISSLAHYQEGTQGHLRSFIFFPPAWVIKALGRFSHRADLQTACQLPWRIDARIADPPSVQVRAVGSGRSVHSALLDLHYLACSMPESRAPPAMRAMPQGPSLHQEPWCWRTALCTRCIKTS